VPLHPRAGARGRVHAFTKTRPTSRWSSSRLLACGSLRTRPNRWSCPPWPYPPQPHPHGLVSCSLIPCSLVPLGLVHSSLIPKALSTTASSPATSSPRPHPQQPCLPWPRLPQPLPVTVVGDRVGLPYICSKKQCSLSPAPSPCFWSSSLKSWTLFHTFASPSSQKVLRNHMACCL